MKRTENLRSSQSQDLLHDWDLSIEEAENVQRNLARKIRLTPFKSQFLSCRNPLTGTFDLRPKRIAGLAYHSIGDNTVAIGLVLMSYPTMELLLEHKETFNAPIPYKTGLAAFHVGPGAINLVSGLKQKPDLLICFGHGIAHPRGCGLASHLGLLLGIPSIGCARTVLYGVPMGGIDKERGAQVPILSSEGDTIGMLLRTRKGVRPILVSCGYLISLEDAVEITLKSSLRFSIPEPIRRAKLLLGEFK